VIFIYLFFLYKNPNKYQINYHLWLWLGYQSLALQQINGSKKKLSDEVQEIDNLHKMMNP